MSWFSSSANAHPQYCHSVSDFSASRSFSRSPGKEASAGRILCGAVGKRMSMLTLSRALRRAPAFLENVWPVLGVSLSRGGGEGGREDCYLSEPVEGQDFESG